MNSEQDKEKPLEKENEVPGVGTAFLRQEKDGGSVSWWLAVI